jgi:hypothetical protein
MLAFFRYWCRFICTGSSFWSRFAFWCVSFWKDDNWHTHKAYNLFFGLVPRLLIFGKLSGLIPLR